MRGVFVGKRGTGEGEFRDITGIAADSFGTTLVVDSRNHRIQLYNKSTLLGVMQVLFLDELVYFISIITILHFNLSHYRDSNMCNNPYSHLRWK